jgi:ABC-2 type transport system ATP-binding protein
LVALDNIDLEIEKGELFGLLGPNGAGKTTLISILSTILPATSGNALVCGCDAQTQQHQVRKCIGIVFQDPSLDDELTGEENLDFHGRLYGMDKRTRISKIDEALRLVDLADRRKDIVKTYSGGMRRRLEIARGLMHKPEVLFLDEPTLGLDPQTRRRIWGYIRELKNSFGMTIILTTHYMEEAERLCSRIAIMDKGAIVALDSPSTLKAQLGGDIVRLEIEGSVDSFLQHVNGLDAINRIAVEDNRVSLYVSHGESFVPKAFELAREAGVEIASVSMRKPNLEDVFLKLTGREIRDEAIKEPKERIRIFMQRTRK